MEIFYEILMDNFIITVTIVVVIMLLVRMIIRERMAQSALREALSFREMLEFAPNPFFAWIYDHKKRKVPLCSRKLAIILSLGKGRNTDFAEVLSNMEDPAALITMIEKMYKDGMKFEAEIKLKGRERYFRCFGNRITTFSGDEVADVLWFEEITSRAVFFQKAKEDYDNLLKEKNFLDEAIDALPFPLWVRNDGLLVCACNESYVKAVEASSKDDVYARRLELAQGEDVLAIRALATKARISGNEKKDTFRIVMESELKDVQITEAVMGKSHNIGWAREVEFKEQEFNRVQEQKDLFQDAVVKSSLMMSVFDADMKLLYCTTRFSDFWELDPVLVNQGLHLSELMEEMKKSRKLPESRDFPLYKNQEVELYLNLKAPHEDVLLLPSGIILKRVLKPYVKGGVIAYFEDMTNQVSLERMFNTLTDNFRMVLENAGTALALFGDNGRLKLWNNVFVKLWKLEKKADKLQNLLLSEIIELKRPFFSKQYDWDTVKIEMLGLITDKTTKIINMQRDDGKSIDCTSIRLADGGILITYKE